MFKEVCNFTIQRSPFALFIYWLHSVSDKGSSMVCLTWEVEFEVVRIQHGQKTRTPACFAIDCMHDTLHTSCTVHTSYGELHLSLCVEKW